MKQTWRFSVRHKEQIGQILAQYCRIMQAFLSFYILCSKFNKRRLFSWLKRLVSLLSQSNAAMKTLQHSLSTQRHKASAAPAAKTSLGDQDLKDLAHCKMKIAKPLARVTYITTTEFIRRKKSMNF